MLSAAASISLAAATCSNASSIIAAPPPRPPPPPSSPSSASSSAAAGAFNPRYQHHSPQPQAKPHPSHLATTQPGAGQANVSHHHHHLHHHVSSTSTAAATASSSGSSSNSRRGGSASTPASAFRSATGPLAHGTGDGASAGGGSSSGGSSSGGSSSGTGGGGLPGRDESRMITTGATASASAPQASASASVASSRQNPRPPTLPTEWQRSPPPPPSSMPAPPAPQLQQPSRPSTIAGSTSSGRSSSSSVSAGGGGSSTAVMGGGEATRLEKLYIRDFALVTEQTVRLGPGLNVITGESGSGKSVLVEAFSQVLGAAAPAECVRAPAEVAIIEGTFVVGPAHAPAVRQLLQGSGLPARALPPPAAAAAAAAGVVAPATGGASVEEAQGGAAAGGGSGAFQLTVRREIALAPGGGLRSRVALNGAPSSLRLLRELAGLLVDTNGQHSTLALRDPATQLELLDRIAGTAPLAAAYGSSLAALRAVEARLDELDELDNEGERARLQKLVDAVNKLRVMPGEERELRRLLKKMEARRSAVEQCGLVRMALCGEAGAGGVTDALRTIEAQLNAILATEEQQRAAAAAEAARAAEEEAAAAAKEAHHANGGTAAGGKKGKQHKVPLDAVALHELHEHQHHEQEEAEKHAHALEQQHNKAAVTPATGKKAGGKKGGKSDVATEEIGEQAAPASAALTPAGKSSKAQAKEPTTGRKMALRAVVAGLGKQAEPASAAKSKKKGAKEQAAEDGEGLAAAVTPAASAGKTSALGKRGAPGSNASTPAANGAAEQTTPAAAGPSSANGKAQAGATTAKKKGVVINLKKNLYFEHGGPVPDPDIRTPPPLRAKGGILKKGSVAQHAKTCPPKGSAAAAVTRGAPDSAGAKGSGGRVLPKQARRASAALFF